MKIFEAQPVIGKRIISLYFEPESTSEISLVIVGNTWNYRDSLEKNGIAGMRSEGGSYIRYVKNVDITTIEGKQQLLSLVDIFNKQALRVVCDPSPEGEVAKFVDELKEINCLHFS